MCIISGNCGVTFQKIIYKKLIFKHRFVYICGAERKRTRRQLYHIYLFLSTIFLKKHKKDPYPISGIEILIDYLNFMTLRYLFSLSILTISTHTPQMLFKITFINKFRQSVLLQHRNRTGEPTGGLLIAFHQPLWQNHVSHTNGWR